MTDRNAASGVAIAVGGTGFKAAFCHGVLAAFEEVGPRATVYAGTSGGALAVAAAAAGQARAAGIEPWSAMLKARSGRGAGMDLGLRAALEVLRPLLAGKLFTPGAPRLIIAASAITTMEGVRQTAEPDARRTGRMLLAESRHGTREWASTHLEPHLFDSGVGDDDPTRRLDIDTLDDVLMAASCMLHAWDGPAAVHGKPYLDGVYTTACPVLELASLGFSDIIAIVPELGPPMRDLFGSAVIPEMAWRSRVRFIKPEVDPARLGADRDTAIQTGIQAAYEHGLERGRAFRNDAPFSSANATW